MFPNVAIVSRPSGPHVKPHAPSPSPAERRRAELAAEARRLARRRLVADAVARRSTANDRALPGDASTQLSARARRKATRLGLVFHRAIEALWAAGGFHEALAIFREHKTEYAPPDLGPPARPIEMRRHDETGAGIVTRGDVAGV